MGEHQDPYGLQPEAFDAECAVLATALEVAARRRLISEKVTIFTDEQAVISGIMSDEPDRASSTP